MECDLDREIAAEHANEEKEQWRDDAGEEYDAMLEEEALIDLQLQSDFESQLSVDTTSLQTSLAAVAAGARRPSRVNRMRAECAAWGDANGGASGGAAGEDDDEDDDDQAQALEQELASAASNTAMLKDWGAAEMDVNAELDWELAQDLDDEQSNTEKGVVVSCDPTCDDAMQEY